MDRPNQLDHKIWGIAWPAILSNISIPLLGLVDAAILGHLGSTSYLAAVAVGTALLSFLYWGFSFLRMGTTGLVARAMGAKEEAAAFAVLVQSMLLALVISVAVIALHPLWLAGGFALMSPQADLLPLAASYAGIRIYSAPAVLVTYTIIGWFIGRQNTRWPLVIVVTTNVINIGLDWLLILGLGLQSDGAAIATVCAEYTGCAIALLIVWKTLPHAISVRKATSAGSVSTYFRLLRSNQYLFVRTVCLLFSFAFFTAMGDKLGSDTLAANALMIQLVMLAAYATDGFAFAAEGLAGDRLGAGDLDGFYAAARRCGWWCAVVSIVISAAFLLLKTPLITLLSDLPQVREIMSAHYLWLVALPVLAAPSYWLDGVFIGSAETRYMMTTMVFSVFIIYLPLWYLTTGLGNHGLWLAFLGFNLARGVTLYRHYRRLSRHHGWLPQSAAANR
tara:strand:- start:216424 stop:217767 length:1344 start_codon:yes stop_codon:yes gene_type:complete